MNYKELKSLAFNRGTDFADATADDLNAMLYVVNTEFEGGKKSRKPKRDWSAHIRKLRAERQ